MKSTPRNALRVVVAAAVLIAFLVLGRRFDQDIEAAGACAARGSTIAATRCGPIEVQEAGSGVPLLVVHGSGGGHNQGMAFEKKPGASGAATGSRPDAGHQHARRWLGTFARAQHTASHIAGAKFIGFDHGGHTWVGRDDEVRSEIVKLLIPPARP